MEIPLKTKKAEMRRSLQNYISNLSKIGYTMLELENITNVNRNTIYGVLSKGEEYPISLPRIVLLKERLENHFKD